MPKNVVEKPPKGKDGQCAAYIFGGGGATELKDLGPDIWHDCDREVGAGAAGEVGGGGQTLVSCWTMDATPEEAQGRVQWSWNLKLL